MTESNFAGEPMIGRHADTDAREDNGNNEGVIDVPTDERVDSAHDDTDNAAPAEPTEHATFVAETDPSTITTPHDPTPEPATVGDSEAAFAAVDSTSTGDVEVPVSNDDSDGSIAALDSVDYVDRSDADFDADPVKVSEPAGDIDGLTASDREVLDFVHENLVVILKDINSLKVLVADIGPTINAIVEEAKAKGLAGVLPLIMSSMRK